jgi:hypothetical protein
MPGMVRFDGKELQVIVTTDEDIGNCPKVAYLHARSI